MVLLLKPAITYNYSQKVIPKQITQYIRGKLTEEEALALWIILLQNPKFIEYLIIELQLTTKRGRY